MHPISLLQGALVTALRNDAALVATVGEGVFDAPPRGRSPPYVVIVRHDLIGRDGDDAPGHEHRLLLACWSDQPSRQHALDIAERVVAVALALSPGAITVTHSEHMRTETVVDGSSGLARAAVGLRFFTE